jgi:hypothetical protein
MLGGLSLATGPIATISAELIGPNIQHLHTFTDSTDSNTNDYSFSVCSRRSTRTFMARRWISQTRAFNTGGPARGRTGQAPAPQCNDWTSNSAGDDGIMGNMEVLNAGRTIGSKIRAIRPIL